MRYFIKPNIIDVYQVNKKESNWFDQVVAFTKGTCYANKSELFLDGERIDDGDYIVTYDGMNFYIVTDKHFMDNLINIPYLETLHYVSMPTHHELIRCSCGKPQRISQTIELGHKLYSVQCECGIRTPWMLSRIGACDVWNAVARLNRSDK